MVLISLLVLWEICQILAMAIHQKLFEYVSLANVIDWIMISTSVSFLIIAPENTEIACHFFGWSMFFGYMNFTLMLAEWSFDLGRTIYMALHVSWSILHKLLCFVPRYAFLFI